MSKPWLLALLLIALSGCDRRVYLADGVTDGNTFYVPPQAIQDQDPVVQSWVAYSLGRSSCELERDSDNPARNHSFVCELWARETLIEVWRDYGTGLGAHDDYLDLLTRVAEADLLDDYVWFYFRRRDWQPPGQLDTQKFQEWRRRELKNHQPETRMIGSWFYKDNRPEGPD